MPDDLRTPKPSRRPVPAWVGLLFVLGPLVGATLLCRETSNDHDREMATIVGLMYGLVCSSALLGGLVMAGHFYHGLVARFLGGILFGALLLVLFWAIIYAGCKCIG